MIEVLKAYGNLPEWLLFLQKSFHRADTSSVANKNPAASDKTNGSITFYDEFYRRPNKVAIVGHEMAHLLYARLSVDDIVLFTDLAGWTLKVEGSQVFETPPTKVLIEDSTFSKEEDFANSVEVYFTAPAKLQTHNPRLYDFFKKRFPQ